MCSCWSKHKRDRVVMCRGIESTQIHLSRHLSIYYIDTLLVIGHVFYILVDSFLFVSATKGSDSKKIVGMIAPKVS